jgi:hypothetical protein
MTKERNIASLLSRLFPLLAIPSHSRPHVPPPKNPPGAPQAHGTAPVDGNKGGGGGGGGVGFPPAFNPDIHPAYAAPPPPPELGCGGEAGKGAGGSGCALCGESLSSPKSHTLNPLPDPWTLDLGPFTQISEHWSLELGA